MQPSSLVFLVIIAVWAAYFVQYWVRRREHLATARSVDQFSESMRVLERRSPLPATDLSTPQPRSYAVTPARVARPQVLVKRAEPTPTATAGAGGSTRADELTAQRSRGATRRTRAVIMLGALATVLVTLPLVALAVVPLLVIAVPVVAVGGALAWSRADAQAQRSARMAARQAAGGSTRRQHAPRPAERMARPAERTPARTQHRTDAQGSTPGSATTTDAMATADATATVDSGATADSAATPAPAPAAPTPVRGELYDVQADETSLRQSPAPEPVAADDVAAAVLPARPLVDEDDIPLTWDPVPVPRPTYTMKARVTRPAPASADLVGDADTEYAAYEETPERRVAGA